MVTAFFDDFYLLRQIRPLQAGRNRQAEVRKEGLDAALFNVVDIHAVIANLVDMVVNIIVHHEGVRSRHAAQGVQGPNVVFDDEGGYEE